MKIRIIWIWLMLWVLAGIPACGGANTAAPKRNDLAWQVPIDLEGSLQNPAWSPDGKSIIITRFCNGYNHGPADLVMSDLESGQVKTLVSDGSDNINLPGSAWNGSTNRIVFSSSREPHDEIYIIRPDGRPGSEIKITERADMAAYEPSFSPDGQWIVFESHPVDVEGSGVIMKYEISGSEEYIALTDAGDDCRQPNWSPDGQYILYQANIEDQWEIWVMESDGDDPHPVTVGAGDKTDASFSPDGQWIVYSGEDAETGFANLFILNITSGEQKRVSDFDGYDGAPSWSPDGSRMIFESSRMVNGEPQETTIWIFELK